MKLFKSLISLAMILFVLWGAISYVDIVADNMKPNPEHYDWNMFVLFTESDK